MDFLTSREVARKLRLQYSTLNKYCYSSPERLPPFFKLNGKRLWNPEEVDKWIEIKKETSNER